MLVVPPASSNYRCFIHIDNRKFDPVEVTNFDRSDQVNAIGGNAWLSNYNLPRIEFADPESVKIFDIVMLFTFALFYDLLGLYYIETNRQWFHNQIRRAQSRVTKSFGMTAGENQIRRAQSRATESFGMTAGQTAKVNDGEEQEILKQEERQRGWPQCLSVRELSYEVPFKSSTSRNIISTAMVLLAGKNKGREESIESIKVEGTDSLMLLHSVNARFCAGHMTGKFVPSQALACRWIITYSFFLLDTNSTNGHVGSGKGRSFRHRLRTENFPNSYAASFLLNFPQRLP
jgi:hypothetical protein